MIRPYRASDLSALLDVWYRASRLAHPFLEEEFLREESGRIETVYLPEADTWIYVHAANVAGFVALIGNEIGGLFVDPELHGRGIGRALVDHTLTIQPELELDVFEANTIGRRFYDRYGFEIIGRHTHEETGNPVLRLRFNQLIERLAAQQAEVER